MMEFVEKLAAIQPKVNDGDYEQDGLLMCGKCHTPKQKRITLLGNDRIVTCMCKCEEKEYEQEEQQRKDRDRLAKIESARTACIQDKRLLDCTFDKDDGQDPVMIGLAKRYVEHWDEMLESNQGLIFCGDVGGGKTFLAGCIANALIDKMVPVLATDFTKIIAALQCESDRNAYIKSLDHYKLIIIDDLGAERQSDYALEQVFAVVNGRYKANKPVIFTTNLSVEELRKPSDVKYGRIYDRILEMCIPVAVKRESRRKAIAEQKTDRARAILLGK